jgi:uncharacterized protein YndB with AHSA1/START domain
MIRRRVELPGGPDRLWTELTDPESVADWMGTTVEWELTPGAPARFTGDDGSRRVGLVEEVRPGERLRFRWWPEDDTGQVSEVTYDLEPHGDGTLLTVTERPTGSDHPAAPAHDAVAWTAWDGRALGLWASARVGAGACA